MVWKRSMKGRPLGVDRMKEESKIVGRGTRTPVPNTAKPGDWSKK